jgi:hypothetical protein
VEAATRFARSVRASLIPLRAFQWCPSLPFLQPATAQQPSAVTSASYYSSYINPVRFARSSGTFMTSGQDTIDLGVSGPFAVYAALRPFAPAPSTIAGRGVWDAVCRTASACTGWTMALANTVFAPSPGSIGMRVADAIGAVAGASVGNAPNWFSLTYSSMVLPDPSGAGLRFQPPQLQLPAGTNWSLVTTCSNSTQRFSCPNVTFVITCANATARTNCSNTTLISPRQCTNTTVICRTANVTVNLTTPWVFRPPGFGAATVGAYRSFGVDTFTSNFAAAQVCVRVARALHSLDSDDNDVFCSFCVQAFGNNFSAPAAITWGNFPNQFTPSLPITSALNFKIGGQVRAISF